MKDFIVSSTQIEFENIMIFVTEFSILRNFKIQFTEFLIREKEKNSASTKDDDKFKSEDIFYYNNNNSIDKNLLSSITTTILTSSLN